MNTEAIVYIARKLNWTLAEIGQLSPSQFTEVLQELQYQESVDEWRRMHSVASIMAAIYNTIPRKRGTPGHKDTDFLSTPKPERYQPKQTKTLDDIAEAKGIKLPKENDG